VVLGITTNLRFLRWLVREPAVRDGLARTDTLERIWPPDDWAARTRVPAAAWSTAAAVVQEAAGDPWSGGWRLNATPTIALDADGTTMRTEPAVVAGITAVRVDDTVHVDVDGRSVAMRLAAPPDVDRAAQAAAATHHGGPVELLAPMPGQVRSIEAGVGTLVGAGDPIVTLEAMKMEHAVVATVPGRVVELLVALGDQVARGGLVAIVEP
jgi:acetyl-CoA/propionyl-CoA carboxylase biotin carboxyl carrier protein